VKQIKYIFALVMEKDINIEDFISNLLYSNDCVIVPGFGGFVTVYKPATILSKQNVMLPPSREIGFNKKLVNNDGLLANEIAVKNHISFEKSLELIQAKVGFYHSELQKIKRLEITNVGVLYIDKDGNYRFMPDASKNFLKKSFGLSKIYLDKIETKKKAVSVEKETALISLVPNEKEEKEKPFAWGKFAAAIAVPLFLLGGYWLGSQMDNSNTSFASLNPFNRTKKEKVISIYQSDSNRAKWDEDNSKALEIESLLAESSEKSITYSFEEERVSKNGIAIFTNAAPKVSIDQSIASEVIPNVSSGESTDDISTSENSLEFNYYIVAGAFQERTNADKLVNKLKRKGFNAQVFDKKKGLNYVCVDGYNTKAAAKAELAHAKKTIASAWVKSK